MSLTARDRKIVIVLVPVLFLLGYWFLLLSPQRAKLSGLNNSVEQAQADRDRVVAQADQLAATKANFGHEYAQVVRLGKAIPTTMDMPSLLVQMQEAARGTRIDFNSIVAGARISAPTPAAPAPGSTQAPSAPDGQAAPGGAQAVTSQGKATESAGNAVNGANAQPGQTAPGGQPATGSSPPPTAGAGTPGAAAASLPGLDAVPLTFKFDGSFFGLADLFHKLKRFVRVDGERIRVRGRLMGVDGFTLKVTPTGSIEAEMHATVYLTPRAQGVTAGATPAGPAPAATPTPASSPPSPGSGAAPPAAVVKP